MIALSLRMFGSAALDSEEYAAVTAGDQCAPADEQITAYRMLED